MFCLKKASISLSSWPKFCGYAPPVAMTVAKRAQNHKGSHDQPLGGGMLGNNQQNSTKLILSIYSLSNVCNNLI